MGEELGRVVMSEGSIIPPGPHHPLSKGHPSPSFIVPFCEMGAHPGSQGCYDLTASKPLAFLRMREEEPGRWEPVPRALGSAAWAVPGASPSARAQEAQGCSCRKKHITDVPNFPGFSCPRPWGALQPLGPLPTPPLVGVQNSPGPVLAPSRLFFFFPRQMSLLFSRLTDLMASLPCLLAAKVPGSS